MGREHALRMFAPRSNGTLRLSGFTEDEAHEDVETTEGEEEECGDECEGVNVMAEDRGSDEHLDEAQGTNTKILSEDWEIPVEKLGWEAELREDEYDGLEDDEEPVEDRPEGACWLVRDGASEDVIRIQYNRLHCRIHDTTT